MQKYEFRYKSPTRLRDAFIGIMTASMEKRNTNIPKISLVLPRHEAVTSSHFCLQLGEALPNVSIPEQKPVPIAPSKGAEWTGRELFNPIEASQGYPSSTRWEDMASSGMFSNRTRNTLKKTFFRINPAHWSAEEQSEVNIVVNDKQGGDWRSLLTSTVLKGRTPAAIERMFLTLKSKSNVDGFPQTRSPEQGGRASPWTGRGLFNCSSEIVCGTPSAVFCDFRVRNMH